MDANHPEFKRKLLFGIALASGALALLMLYSYMNAQKEQNARQIEVMKQQIQSQAAPASQPVQMAAVLVAAHEIKQGAVITSGDVAAKSIPREYLTPGVISANANIIGLTALSSIAAGEQILQGKVGQPEKPKLLSAITPAGKRAVSVTVDNNLAGLLQPGDYVDVLAMIHPPADSPLYALAVSASNKGTPQQTEKLVTLPLFQNILVLTVGNSLERKEGVSTTGRAGDNNAVTLSLSPQEAALAAFVQEQGKIKLVMRSNSDMADSTVQAVNWDSLFEHLYPESRKQGMKRPATVEIYRGLRKETVALPIEGQTQ